MHRRSFRHSGLQLAIHTLRRNNRGFTHSAIIRSILRHEIKIRVLDNEFKPIHDTEFIQYLTLNSDINISL